MRPQKDIIMDWNEDTRANTCLIVKISVISLQE